ncbi:guanine nucleotide-binding protein alpha-1 subunit [Backusella circina FSU 941]|nr:guanine nucleotide-binding protein alpha-1 subunit [Backusella circina FSU 941]
MGCVSSKDTSSNDQALRNKAIDTQIKQDRLNLKNEVKLLLLGAGESGKSTIIKQMKLIHEGTYLKEEKEAYKEIVFSNIIQSMQVILEAMDTFGVSLNPENEPYKEAVEGLSIRIEDGRMPSVEAIRTLWGDPHLQSVFDQSHDYQLNDSAKYFFDSIDRIGSPDYIPTDQDVLRARVKTTGISETIFHVGELTYRMYDVGGQRSERKKWIHCFENVMAVIFMVAISEYDQVLIEDESVNRMEEALALFDSICNSVWFKNTSMILFLNKIDIFKDKLTRFPLHESIPEYNGPNTYEAASEYIMERFLGLNKSKEKQIYTHFTCATDTNQIRFVMTAVNDIIIQHSLRDVGLL